MSSRIMGGGTIDLLAVPWTLTRAFSTAAENLRDERTGKPSEGRDPAQSAGTKLRGG